jgi:hypothetical protein
MKYRVIHAAIGSCGRRWCERSGPLRFRLTEAKLRLSDGRHVG